MYGLACGLAAAMPTAWELNLFSEFDEDELQDLIKFVNSMDLNEFNRELHREDQTNCW